MSQNDPTDSALAAIASIFGPVRSPADSDEQPSDGHDTRIDTPAADPAAAEATSEATGSEIAQPESGAAVSSPEAALPSPELESGIDGYSRSGPGPLDSLRFKWTARRSDTGEYFVDETIGYASRPIASGPFPRDEVIAYIDERERQARQRFAALRDEMIHSASDRSAAIDQDGEN